MQKIKFYQTQAPFGKILETDFSTEALNVVTSLETNGAYCPGVKRVVANTKTFKSVPILDNDGKHVVDKHGNPMYKRVQLDHPLHTTIVEFVDGTKSIVQCSAQDKPNVETAIVNAIVKRVFGIPDPKTGIVDGSGTGTWLRKLSENVWDQQAEMAKIKEAKSKAKAEHEARQIKEHQAAHERKINKLAKEISNYVEALEKLGYVTKTTVQPNEKSCACSCSKTPTASAKFTDLPKAPVKSESAPYVRPNKKFSEFTQEEKRAYWRAQKRGFIK